MTQSNSGVAFASTCRDEGGATTDTTLSPDVTPKDAVLRRPGRASTLPPGHRIGQYELVRLLGRGGMGQVHLARDLRLGRLVALKLMNARRPSRIQRFLAEARATARCHHENIVVIHEVAERDGQPYMVLEYLEGQTLRQWMREHAAASGQRAPVPPGRAVELMLPVVRALAYAHERSIVHRDLKPENILLSRTGTVKVLDFGLAKLLAAPDEGTEGSAGSVAVRSSALVGTLPYMSPEQMRVGVIDHRSDLWAVGIILFELVTGAHPVPSRTIGELRRIADEDTPMPSARERMPALGPLAAVIDRCLQKNPEHRTASARALLAELEACVPGRGVASVGEGGSPAVRDALARREQGYLASDLIRDTRATRRRRWFMAGTLLAVLLFAFAWLGTAEQAARQQVVLSQDLAQALQREQAQNRAAEQARREAEAARREAAVQSAGIRETSHSDANLFSVWGTASDDVSAVGFSGEGGSRSGTVLHHDGHSWQPMYTLPQGELYGVWVNAPDDRFAVGAVFDGDLPASGIVLHYDGQSWQQVHAVPKGQLISIWAAAPDDVFAVGLVEGTAQRSGIVLHYDGQSWQQVHAVPNGTLYGLWATASDDVFAVGAMFDGDVAKSGIVLHYDGQTWQQVHAHPAGRLHAVWATAPDDVFVVGGSEGPTNGIVLHYDGQSWQRMSLPVSAPLYGVWGSGVANVFAVGSGGTVLHYDGQSWTPMRTGTSDDLVSVWGPSAQETFFVGENGSIYHRD